MKGRKVIILSQNVPAGTNDNIRPSVRLSVCTDVLRPNNMLTKWRYSFNAGIADVSETE